MVASAEQGERSVALERQIATEKRHLATKADISDPRTGIESLKSWFMWRLLIGAAVVQGIIAALIKYLP